MPSTSAACSADACDLPMELASELPRLRCSGVSRSTQATDAARWRRSRRRAPSLTHACAPASGAPGRPSAGWTMSRARAAAGARCLDLAPADFDSLLAHMPFRPPWSSFVHQPSPAAHGGSPTGGRCVCLARVPGLMHSVARPPRSGASCRLYHSLLSPTVRRGWESTAQRRRGGHHCHQFHPATCWRINGG